MRCCRLGYKYPPMKPTLYFLFFMILLAGIFPSCKKKKLGHLKTPKTIYMANIIYL